MKAFVALVAFALASVASAGAAEKLPVFNAILTVGKEHRFVLVSQPGGKPSTFLQLGDKFDGYVLKGFDAKSGVLEIERDGKVSKLTLVADAAVTSAPATTPATIADASAMLTAMNFEKMMDQTMEGVKRQQASAMQKMVTQMAGNADREAVVEFQKKVVEVMMSGISGAEIQADVARLYSEIFSREELQALSAFYSSPVGQSFAEKQPIVTERMNELMMPRIMANMPKVQQMGREFAAQQKAKKEAAAGAASPPAKQP